MTLDRYAIFRHLQVEQRGIFIVDVDIALSGTVTLDCRYDPERLEPFQLVFEGCKNIAWETFETTPETTADVMSLFLGQGNYQERAIIHTDMFEVSLLYQHLLIQKPHVVWSDAPGQAMSAP